MMQRAEGDDLVMMVNQDVRRPGLWIMCQGNLLKNNLVHHMSIPAALGRRHTCLVGLTEVREFDRIIHLSNFLLDFSYLYVV
jgi:hypothetical protein